MANEATGHATNEALTGVEARLKDHFAALLAQSEARQMRWSLALWGLAIAAITILNRVL